MRKTDARESFAEMVAAQLIEKLEAGTAPWQVPWVPGSQEGVENCIILSASDK